jgi:6-phosphogluconolactonase
MPRRELVVVDDPSGEAAARLTTALREAVGARGRATLALSGGRSPAPMFERLDPVLPWPSIDVIQVDERVAPDGDPERNLTIQLAHLPPPARERLRPMPVTIADLDAAAHRYATELPDRLDAVHLGLGEDGHTASLVPDDPVLEIADRDVAATDSYEGHRRMTLTLPSLARAGLIVWLVTGAAKAEALRMLLADDPRIPASRVAAPRQVVVADPDAVATWVT